MADVKPSIVFASQRIGAAIASVHLIAFAITCVFAYVGESMSEFILLIWIPIDIPVSIVTACAHGISPLNVFEFCRYDGWPWIATLFAHGVLGTVMWYFVGKYAYVFIKRNR